MSSSVTDVTSGEALSNTDSKGVRSFLTGFIPGKKDVDHSKLYEQEKKRAKDLERRLENIYGNVVNATTSKLRSERLRQVISKDYGPDNARRAVDALIDECQLYAKDRLRLDGLVREYKEKTHDLENERDTEIQQRILDTSRLESQKRQLKFDHDKQMARAQTEWQVEKDRMNSIISQKDREHDYKMDQMKRDHQSKIIQMQMDFDHAKALMESGHADQQGRLKRDIETLNGALVKREHFRPLSDNDIKSLFSDLAIDLDHLARLGWKHNQTDWTDGLLSQVAKNPRRVKKNILQESLWSVLYDNIFCSPFRVLGEEGRNLETEWSVAFGREYQVEKGAYSWPKAGLDSERWRYETIKKCQEALAQPTSEWDPRYKLKKGFESSLDVVNKGLSEMILKVSDLDNDTVQALEDVSRKAAKIWIEFNTQRCRILVDMSCSSLKLTSSDRLRKVRESSLELVVVPPLRRFGNSKGQDLDKEEKIAGCEGTIERLSIDNP